MGLCVRERGGRGASAIRLSGGTCTSSDSSAGRESGQTRCWPDPARCPVHQGEAVDGQTGSDGHRVAGGGLGNDCPGGPQCHIQDLRLHGDGEHGTWWRGPHARGAEPERS